MAVSTRNTLLRGAGFAALVLLAAPVASGGGGCGAGCTGTPGTGVVLPAPVPLVAPGIGQPVPRGPGCCDVSPGVVMPGVTLHVPGVVTGSPVLTGAATFSHETSGFAGVQTGGRTSSFARGGGGGFAADAAPQSRVNLGAQTERYTETVTEEVPVTERVCLAPAASTSSDRGIDAACVDGKGGMYPASRLADGNRIAAGYSGELFYCLIGTRMEARIGAVSNGRIDVATSEMLRCGEGETIIHGDGGTLSCAPHPTDCNCAETSIVRTFGPGLKLLAPGKTVEACVPTERTIYKTVSRNVERERLVPGQAMMLTGGVGNGVN